MRLTKRTPLTLEQIHFTNRLTVEKISDKPQADVYGSPNPKTKSLFAKKSPLPRKNRHIFANIRKIWPLRPEKRRFRAIFRIWGPYGPHFLWIFMKPKTPTIGCTVQRTSCQNHPTIAMMSAIPNSPGSECAVPVTLNVG